MTAPTDYGNLTGWYDASQAADSDGATVASVTDFGGASRHLTQATEAAKPTFRASAGGSGKKAYEFDGTDDFVTGAAVSNFVSASAFTVFAAFSVDAVNTALAATYDNDGVWADDDGYIGLFLHSTAPSARLYNWDGTDDHADITIATSTRMVVMCRHESGNLYISVNGGSETSVASGNTSQITAALIAGRNGTNDFFDGFLHELFFYSVARSTAEISALNTYLYDKWVSTGATGTVAETLANATSAAAGASGASGSLAETLDAVTVAASGSSVSGTVARTLANVTSAAAGTHSIVGTLAVTLANSTSAAAGASGGSGSLAETLADVTSAASGTFTDATVTGTLAETLGDTTSAAAGSSVTGTIAATLGALTSSASGASGAAGTLAETLADATVAASGTHTPPDITGTLAETLANITAAASGTLTPAGTVAVTLAAVQATAALTDEDGNWLLDEDGLPILPEEPSGAAGAHGVSGTVARTLAAATSAAAGTVGAATSYDWTGTNGDPWAGWTAVVGTVDIQSNKGRQLTAATAYAVAAAYYNTALPQDYELRVDSTITTVTAAEFYGTINVRAGSTSFTDMMQWSSWHLRFVGALGTAELYRVNSSGVASAILQGGAGIGFVQGSVLRVRVNVTGNRFRARYWKNAETEPSTWQIDYTDATPPTGTRLSLGVRAGNNASADDWRWDDFAVTAAAVTTGTLARTLAGVMTQAYILDENNLPVLDENGDPILADATFGTVGVAADVTGTLAETLANVTSTTAGVASVSGTLARTLENATAAASGGSSTGGTLARTLANVTSSATGAVGVSGSLAETLGNVTSAASGSSAEVSGTVAVTLDSVETGAPLTDDLGDVVTDDAGNIVYVRGAEGTHGIGGTLAETLDNVTSTAIGSATSVVGTVAETLDDVTVAASGTFAAVGTVAETLADVTLVASGTVGVAGSLAETLGDTTSAADGTSDPLIVAGNLAVTLAAVTSAADGSTVGGSLAETLADTTSAADGTAGPVSVTGTLAVTLGNVTSQTAGSHTVTGTLARTLADVVADAVGSSVAGTVAVTLEDVTSITTGNVTITVYGVGRIESVYQMGPIEAVFETGRVVAVAGSRV